MWPPLSEALMPLVSDSNTTLYANSEFNNPKHRDQIIDHALNDSSKYATFCATPQTHPNPSFRGKSGVTSPGSSSSDAGQLGSLLT